MAKGMEPVPRVVVVTRARRIGRVGVLLSGAVALAAVAAVVSSWPAAAARTAAPGGFAGSYSETHTTNGVPFQASFTITQKGGTLTGQGISDGLYHFKFTGTAGGNHITWKRTDTDPGRTYVATYKGTRGADGTLTGTWSDNTGFTGTWTATRTATAAPTPSLEIVCGEAKSGTEFKGCGRYEHLSAPTVPVAGSTLDAAVIHVRLVGKGWDPDGEPISLLFGGKVIHTVAPIGDFEHDIYALTWPERTGGGCSAQVEARQGSATVTRTLEGRAIGRVFFVDNQRLLKYGDDICAGEEATFEHTTGSVMVLTGRTFDYFSGPTVLRGVSIPRPEQHICLGLFPKTRGVVVVTGQMGGTFNVGTRQTC